MALSKEFYLDEIRSKYPNSYNEGLKDLPVKDLEDMLDFLDQALGKADGGAIGIEVLFTDKKPRKNFFMGGPALEGQALSIYNSMNAYGFSDQEIANTLEARGLYDVKPAVTTPVINTAPNIINQGDDGDDSRKREDTITSYDPNVNLGPNKDVIDYEADAYGRGPTFKGQLARAYIGLKSLPTPFNIASKAIGNISDFFKKKAEEKREKELQDFYNSTQAAITRDIARDNKAAGTGGYQAGYGSGFMEGPSGAGYGMGAADKGGSDTMGSFKRGGLATMFTRRR